MARRPKRINLEAISDTTHKDHKKHVMALVEDLLRKFPRGPECALVAEDYCHHWSGHPQLIGHEHESGTQRSCGYDDLTLYRFCAGISVDGGEWDFSWKVKEWYPNLGKNGVTRRSRRLAHRIESAYRRVMRAGRPGIYRVDWEGRRSYGTAGNKMYVHAESSEMAKMIAKTSVGPSYPDLEPSAYFEAEGCPSTLMGKNNSTVAEIKRKAEELELQIKNAQAQIELLELRAAMLQTYSITAVG